MPQSPDARDRNKPKEPTGRSSLSTIPTTPSGTVLTPTDIFNLLKLGGAGFQDIIAGPQRPTDEPVDFLGGQLNRGLAHAPGVGGPLELLGSAGSLVTGLFGLPAAFDERVRSKALPALATLPSKDRPEGDIPGPLDIFALARFLNAARDVRAGELGSIAEDESQPFGERARAGAGQFLYGGLPNFAPFQPAIAKGALRGAKAGATGAAKAATEFSPAEAAGSFAESIGYGQPERVTARSTAKTTAQSLAEAEDAYRAKYIQVAEDAPIDQAARTRDLANIDRLRLAAEREAVAEVVPDLPEITSRYAAEVGKTRTVIKDTQTGETLPHIFMGPDQAANAAAEVARRNAAAFSSDAAKVVAGVVPESSPLRKLTTPQLGALHGVTTNPAEKAVIEALLGERAFAMAPADQITMAVNLVDRDVATQVRRALRGVADADVSGVEAAVDTALAEAKVPKTPANRAAVLQELMDQQARNNVRNAEINSARKGGRGGGGEKPPAPPKGPEPLPPDVEAVVGKRGLGRQVYESIRSLKSLIDLPLGRQGIRVVGNPVAFAKSVVAAFKGYKQGPKAVTNWLEAKKSDPLWQTSVEKGGVEYTSAEAGSVVGKIGREELYPGGAVESAPVLGGAIQHSNAAYTHSLNVARYEKFKSDLRMAEWLWKHLFREKGPLPDSEIAGIGRNVNVATGRGQLGKFGAVGEELGSAFFSPRNTISWPQFFTDWALHLKNGNKVAAAIQAKTLVTYLGFSVSTLLAKEALGSQVEWDPRSSDFMKIVDGDQRTDIMGGGQQWMVALARIATGESKSLKGEISPTSPEDVLGSFVLNRTHPALGAAEDVGRLALTTARRAIEGKPFTGTAVDPYGSEFGIVETILGAVAPIIAENFIQGVRFEMEVDNKSLGEALAEVGKAQIPAFFGFGSDFYRAGAKVPAIGGELGDATPEKPLTPQEILLSGALQKQQVEQVAAARKQALDALTRSQQYQALPPASQKKLADSLSEAVGRSANKAFGMNLALNGKTERDSQMGALIAFANTPKNYDRGQLLATLYNAGRLTDATKAAIDARRDQPDRTKADYDLSVEDYIHGAQLVDLWLKSPPFEFGSPNEWTSAARAADLLRKMIADDARRGVKPSDDPQVAEFYDASPLLSLYYERDGSRRTKYVSPQRRAIEADLLWSRFADAAREKESK